MVHLLANIGTPLIQASFSVNIEFRQYSPSQINLIYILFKHPCSQIITNLTLLRFILLNS